MAKQYSFADFKRILENTKPAIKVEVVDGKYVARGELATPIQDGESGLCSIIHAPSLHEYQSQLVMHEAVEIFEEFELRED